MSPDDQPTSWLPKRYPYDQWMESTGLPIHRGYYLPDLRTLAVEWWAERRCRSAFIQLTGNEGIVATRITELDAGRTAAPLRSAFDEAVYVCAGSGRSTIWSDRDSQKQVVEWREHTLFLVPRHHYHVMEAGPGQTARVFQYSHFPLALSVIPDVDVFFNGLQPQRPRPEINVDISPKRLPEENSKDLFGLQTFWHGAVFPNMNAWSELEVNNKRGGGGRSALFRFAHSQLRAHMSEFPAQVYKKAHRHGPGRAILLASGEGYTVMWEEGREKIVCPWREFSMITPPPRWFHQHFNSSPQPAKYLALHPPAQFHGHAEKIEDRARDQIEYPDEDPFIRAKFEEELGKRGVRSLMPEECYQDRNFSWGT